jgi:hypothetical protein
MLKFLIHLPTPPHPPGGFALGSSPGGDIPSGLKCGYEINVGGPHPFSRWEMRRGDRLGAAPVPRRWGCLHLSQTGMGCTGSRLKRLLSGQGTTQASWQYRQYHLLLVVLGTKSYYTSPSLREGKRCVDLNFGVILGFKKLLRIHFTP